MGLIRPIFIALFLVVLAGCSPNPGAPPHTPAEIPSSLRIPASVAVDVDRLRPEPSGGALKGQVPPGGEFSEAISLGFTLTSEPLFPFASNPLLEIFVLNAFSSLDIPVSPTTFTFEALTPEPTEEKPNPFAEGERVKIDFGDFDFDGDGTAEGCTGCTCPAGCAPDIETCPSELPEEDLRPVCLRIWVTGLRDETGVENPDFQRFMAFVFDRLPVPTQSNIGTGRLRASLVANPIGESFFFGAGFDHVDPLNRASDVSIFAPTFFGEAGDFFDVHTLQTQEGEVSSARKTVFASVGQTRESAGTSETQIQYIGRFLENEDFWDGTVKRLDTNPGNGVDETIDFTDICAQLSSGDGASPPLCEDLGINVTGEVFIDRSTPSDGALPSDFPQTPTF